MALLAIHQPDARSGARLTAALSGAHRFVPFETWDGLLEGLSSGDLEGALLDADHPNRKDALARVRLLRGTFPDLALVGFTERSRPGEYFDLGQSGLEAFVSEADGPLSTRNAVDEALALRRGRVVRRLLQGHLPSPGPEAIGWALSHSGGTADVDDLARALGFSLYALRGILHERALPAPSVLMLWGRLLAAAGRLYGDGRKVEETAFALGYASAPSLGRALRTHTGLTPSQVAATSFSRMLSLLIRSFTGVEAPPVFDEPVIPPAGASPPTLGP